MNCELTTNKNDYNVITSIDLPIPPAIGSTIRIINHEYDSLYLVKMTEIVHRTIYHSETNIKLGYDTQAVIEVILIKKDPNE